jgi:vitamin B12 transporter
MKKINFSLIASAIITSSVYANLNEAKITISSATKSEQSIQDVTSNVEVITGAELQSKNITTLTQALNLVSGIDYTSNGGIGKVTTINLRGMGNPRVLVLIDGQSMQDPSSTSGAMMEHIMINDIDRIEVIKGAQSGIWGANAAAGVINVITKNYKDGLHGQLMISKQEK